MNFTEPVQDQFTDEALDAICLEGSVCTYALEDLRLEEISPDDHRVSLIIPVHRDEVHILHHHPELPGEGQPEDGIVFFLIGPYWVLALWGGLSWKPGSEPTGCSLCFSKASPESMFGSGGKNNVRGCTSLIKRKLL